MLSSPVAIVLVCIAQRRYSRQMGNINQQGSLCPPGPKELGEYLLKLDKDDDLYNQYFQVGFTMKDSNPLLFIDMLKLY